ncbi:hypothetical protein ABTM97_19170, partial [Acinetobacter baumannii]
PVMYRAVPQAKNLFLYRDGISWARSIYRTWSPDRSPNDQEQNREMQKRWSDFIPLGAELGDDLAPLNPVEIRVCAWLQIMEGYLDLRSRGIPVFA